MTVERLNAPRWRRRRTDTPEDDLLAPGIETTRALLVDPLPVHRPLASRNPTSVGSWAGRASDHRRSQVRSRGPEPVRDGPTGPVESTRSAEPSVDPLRTRVEQAWTLVVQVLGHEVGAVSSALLSTADGRALAAHGLAGADVPGVARVTSAAFATGSEVTAARHGARPTEIETIQLSSGSTHTVVASIPVAGHGTLVLSVTADSVGPEVMLAQTRQAADGLRELLSAVQ